MPPSERVLVLMYHRVGAVQRPEEARYCVTPRRFEAQMQALAKHGFRGVPIESLIAWLEGGSALREGDFVLTFDDGFSGVRDHALPTLERLGWPFAVFLVTDLLGQVDAWKHNDGTASAQHSLLSADDLPDMARRGASFHSHTCRHRSLPKLSDSELQAELVMSRNALVRLVGEGDRYLAYPYGHTDDRVVAAARQAGYRAGLSVQPGFNRQDVDRFRIRRLDISGTDTPSMLLRKMRLGSNDGSRMADLRYAAGRIAGRFGLRAA